MNKLSKKKTIILTIFSALILVLTYASLAPASGTNGLAPILEPGKGPKAHFADHPTGTQTLNRYEQYVARHAEEKRPAAGQIIRAEAYSGTEGMQASRIESFSGASGPVVLTEEAGTIYWDIDIEESGLYHLGIRYYPVEGNSSPIERELLIDGETPFEEASRLVFSRVWGNRLPEIERDSRDNDLRPGQVEHPQWQETVVRDAEGYYKEAFSFYLSAGKHTIGLVSLREPMIIDYLQLYQEEQVAPYSDVAQAYEQAGYEPTIGQFVKIQGENAVLKSNPSLYPLNDRTSPATEPYHVSKIRMNTIGGVNWKIPGQWITWEVDIPEDGLYEFGLRYKQNASRGINVVRKLYINDQVPFKEAEAIPFPYAGGWQVGLPGEDGKPYLFYLPKGTHQIKLELTMGELSDVIRTVRRSIQELNMLYLQIVMLTGTVPDPFRDYQLESKIPGLEQIFAEQSEVLNQAADWMDEMVGGASGSTTILRTTAYQLQDIGSRPETITSRLKQFKDNVSSLGTWLLTVNQQPLEIDYLFFKSPDVDTPPAESGWFGRMKHEVLSFLGSFSEDYSSGGSGQGGEDEITVWVASGRDQAQLLRSMIDNMFTLESGIHVNLQLVNGSVILPATLAGKGPDVAISMGDVINFAMRGALQDLTEFEDFEQVSSRFMDSAFVGFMYQDGVFAIPETQSFPMLFYRKDILDELELPVPDTWEDMYKVIPELQKHNMELAMPHTIVFETMLYQNGGQYYQGDGIAAALDSDVGTETFGKWTELYTNYKLPLEFDFINRFRTGEMPIGIADYSTYNFLTVFAPEIRGQWNFAPLPGVREADGTVRRDTLSTAGGTVMFKKANNKQSAWEFIRWWTDAEAQVTFGREMEAILGESARYAAANLQALERLPWSARELNELMNQFEWVRGRPAVPGDYSLNRHLNNAFYEVYNDGSEPRETLENYVRTINQEITIKREEFGLPTLKE
ncbi:extracellular solute-binding protein [Paenibacillus sp. J2TS4]|uniref:extracellular solute-binding protein n=1 Tax=Paenibacillus sp. J2TS4 TaxID=2807194 RepID=UPI001B239961|nr:extracellular solute-binding protein [Paenibacillus sp. J2TS4]GIP34503.1 ABC transporter substrate-binding protein [Paenibacillus sp. J2TS4]